MQSTGGTRQTYHDSAPFHSFPEECAKAEGCPPIGSVEGVTATHENDMGVIYFAFHFGDGWGGCGTPIYWGGSYYWFMDGVAVAHLFIREREREREREEGYSLSLINSSTYTPHAQRTMDNRVVPTEDRGAVTGRQWQQANLSATTSHPDSANSFVWVS